jgi:hypothetical protein
LWGGGSLGTLVPMYQPLPKGATMPADPRSQIRGFHLDAPRTRVMPLFTARGEREWAPGWEPVMLSGAERRGSAFQTRNHEGRVTTWIVIDYRPSEGRASYARLTEGSNIGLVDVVCTEARGGGTDVSVAYTLTPLNAEAEGFVRHFLEPETYGRMIEEWRAATSAALARSVGVRDGRMEDLPGEDPGADQGKDQHGHEGGKHPEPGSLCGCD